MLSKKINVMQIYFIEPSIDIYYYLKIFFRKKTILNFDPFLEPFKLQIHLLILSDFNRTKNNYFQLSRVFCKNEIFFAG